MLACWNVPRFPGVWSPAHSPGGRTLNLSAVTQERVPGVNRGCLGRGEAGKGDRENNGVMVSLISVVPFNCHQGS